MSKTFESLANEFVGKICASVSNMALARTLDEAVASYDETHHLVLKYAKEIKKVIEESDTQAVLDHSMMTKVLNERYALDPSKVTLEMNIKRNLIQWKVCFLDRNKKDLIYVSRRGAAVDAEKWSEWLSNML